MKKLKYTDDIQELIKLRRDFHEFPEPGWLEYRTSAKIADALVEYGYEVHVGETVCESTSRMGVPNNDVLKHYEEKALNNGANLKWVTLMEGGHTGVVGVLKTGKPGPIIALRFDIDALPLTESKDDAHLPTSTGFYSKYEGVMHACGHDGHAAIGLGTAKNLMKNKDILRGEIRLIFQPAEEGCRGAKSIVDKGWLNNVDYFYSGHIAFQSFKLGEIVASVGDFLATTKLDVIYKGKSAHAGSNPELGKNALLAAAAASLHLHGIPRHSVGKSRINVGKLQAGSGRNIIPNNAAFEIETRGGTKEINEYMTKEAIRIVENTAKVYDVECELEVVGEATTATSDEEFMLSLHSEIESVEGVHTVKSYAQLNASEDVVYMLNKVQKEGGKASYLLFGSPIPAGHHDVLFDFDEKVLSIGSEVLTRLVLTSVKQKFKIISGNE